MDPAAEESRPFSAMSEGRCVVTTLRVSGFPRYQSHFEQESELSGPNPQVSYMSNILETGSV